jgi:hypothetical protein
MMSMLATIGQRIPHERDHVVTTAVVPASHSIYSPTESAWYWFSSIRTTTEIQQMENEVSILCLSFCGLIQVASCIWLAPSPPFPRAPKGFGSGQIHYPPANQDDLPE